MQPAHAGALDLLAIIALQAGQPETAVHLLRQAIVASPQIPAYHDHLGSALRALGRADEALAAYRQAIRLHPDFVEAHSNLSATLGELRQFDQALASARRALALDPQFFSAYYNLGVALAGQRNYVEALSAYRQGLAILPTHAKSHNNVGTALRSLGRLSEAVAAFRCALALEPNFAMAHSNLGAALLEKGLLDAALTSHRLAQSLQPGVAAFHGNLLRALHYCPRSTLPSLSEAHREYDRLHAAPLRATWRLHANSPDPHRPLRVGFVSPHFARHPVGRFLIRPLEHLDRSQFHLICYSDTAVADEMTARIRAAAHSWQEIGSLHDEALAERIRADRVDILFDLAGQTAGHRLGVFARKPAPLQITWLDYVGTTGLSAMDYILADPHQIPAEAEPLYCEKVLRMPHDYICFDPPADAPPVNPLPALTRGGITFGSFNILAKTTPEIVAVWARILHRVPGSRLVLMTRGLDQPRIAERYLQMFLDQGIPAERLELRGWSPPEGVLACYHEIDVALDTWPYNGGLTTCEALWMGVPVVTSPGQTFASRHGLTHLTAAGFPEGIAGSLDDYVDLAVSLGNDLPRLAELRAAMRPRMAASPLCDGPAFAAHLQAHLRAIWQRWTRETLTP